MTEQRNQVIIFGCGGHARSVADIIISNERESSLLFVDENAGRYEKLYGYDVVRHITQIDRPYFFALGDNVKRKAKYDEIGTSYLISVTARGAYTGYGSRIGRGCFIGNFCHIGPQVEIGDNTIVNTSAVIEHEVRIGRHCHVAPGVIISGRCMIGDMVFIGVGAAVKDFTKICDGVTIGAGATVTSDIDEPGTYVGTPARKIS